MIASLERPSAAALVVLAAFATAAACTRAPQVDADAETPVGVTVQVVRTATLRDVATAPGTVVPSTAGDLTIYAPEGASIAELPKREGDEVAIGDVLVRFDIPSVSQELAAAELAVGEAQARADAADANYRRLTDLFDRGLAARAAFETARNEQTTAQSMLGQAKSQLALVQAEASRAVIRAGFPGRVLRVWHLEGDMVMGGDTDPVLRLVDPSRVQVSVQLPISQLARIVTGQTATVRAFDVETPFAATVATKRGAADPTAPTGEVRLTFDQPPTLALDTPVSVEILLDQRTDVIVVPTEAVLRDTNSTFVVVAGEDGRAHRREVRPGLGTRTLTQIAAGLEVGERVIVGGNTDVDEGTPVTFAN